ncbi:polysaccharide biosynthesis protein [Paenibacillus mesophilus]|uniref:polysaccharide biosynthesis protein n=1 Tax=Paenibacillus mesophilus TaxID=2582849 RepID=UPI00110D457F|nr:nucleoside-diphosphate sugar epimerase/dehydratase [Paenibacillus mesophilus]TMV47495.1 polysaccharide biosynthesis protein [Paenibacillus mesophilus]
MSFNKRLSALLVTDTAFVVVSVLTSYLLHYNWIVAERLFEWTVYTVVSVIVCTLGLAYFKLYNRVWQYASVGELLTVIKAVSISCMISYGISIAVIGEIIPAALLVRHFETLLLLVGGSRFAWRVYRDSRLRKKSAQRRALIIGAGDCGTLVAKELKSDYNTRIDPVAFIDDDVNKNRLQVLGIPIFGGREKIPEAVEQLQIDDIIIAVPSVSKKETSKIIEVCKSTKAQLKIIPRIGDLVSGNVTVKEIRNVEVEDLLGREAIHIDLKVIANYVTNKTVLVTGAGGSIGSELCRQLARFKPKLLLLLGQGENSIYAIEMELRRTFPEQQIDTLIANVQDRERIDAVFAQFKPQVVFHAAAHKHVPLMERNPAEAIKNNVFGTKNVADSADKYEAERFVLISTDKAVNPTSVMGTTKRIAEMYIQSLKTSSRTKFAAVRFGNVLGSRGSVIPKFKEQIMAGGPVTVTHPDMIRYFMTIPEAVQLVIQAGAIVDGGEVFILDMGEPVKILDLAKDLIRLSGFEPNVDIEITYTGIRPGEKLYEELLTSEEGLTSTKHNRIYIGKPASIERALFETELARLYKVIGREAAEVKDTLRMVVPSYHNGAESNRKELISVG